jgi:TPR repeat protein
MAYAWFLRAGRNGNAGSLTRAAICHLNGTGVARTSVRGMCMAHEAAVMGSEHACSLIAMGYASGRWGMDEDKAEAAYWYRRATKASIRDTPEECRKRGKAYLEAHGGEARVVDAMLGAYNNDSAEEDENVNVQ